MYVQVTTTENNQQSVFVMGESLTVKEDGQYLLPGRLIHALKPDDLPIGIGFSLADTLPSGYGFYQEDKVIFKRLDSQDENFSVQVISTYQKKEWDGLFPLEATLLSRKQALELWSNFHSICYDSTDEQATIRYAFSYPTPEEADLERVMEGICDTVFEVEARGNLQLWHRHTGPSAEGESLF